MLFQKRIVGNADKCATRDIDVLVLGNRGAGKTSLLAATLYDMDGKLKDSDIDFTADEETTSLLKKSIGEMQDMFTQNGDIEVGGGIGGTDGFQDFTFQLKFADDSWDEASDFNITFHDYAGSILADGRKDKQYEKLKKYFLKSQIVYILIDTPYLMETAKKTIEEHSAKEQILALFQEAGTESIGKLVAIVPTKCECYLRSRQIVAVEDKIEREFKELLSHIRYLNETEGEGKYKLYITPVQTVGGLEFCEMKEEGGEQIAVFRRTRPGSQFNPKNTDLLLLLCLDHLFESISKYLVERIGSSKRNKIIKALEKCDDEKKLADCIDTYRRLEAKDKKSAQLDERFRKMVQEFFSEYGTRESVIGRICKQYGEIRDCYIVSNSKKKLEDDSGNDFRQHFKKLL